VPQYKHTIAINLRKIMGEAKHRKAVDPNYGKNNINTNDYARLKNKDQVGVTFLKFNGVVYNYDNTQELNINIASKSSRYSQFKGIIDAAIEDLKNKPDGKWVYIRPKEGWINIPMCLIEIMGILVFDENAERLLNLSTPTKVYYCAVENDRIKVKTV
jgi:hypothetical protein